jgi:hypothetical protein
MKSSAWVLHSSQALTDGLALVPFIPPSALSPERGFSPASVGAFYSMVRRLRPAYFFGNLPTGNSTGN